MNKKTLENEASKATEMLLGKVVSEVHRHRENEVAIIFTDGTRLFIDKSNTGVELSITGGSGE